jgi:hypothetical protein
MGIVTTPASIAAEPDSWQYEVTPYFLAAGLNGTAGVRGVTADVDMSFSDVMDSLEGGFMGLFAAQKGRWSYGLEGVYFKLGDEATKSVSGPFGQVTVNGALELTTKMYIYQGTVGYRLVDEATSVDLLGGLRYTKLDAEANVVITTVPGIVFPGGAISASGSESWTDAVAGVRAIHPLSDNLDLIGYADVGAGGSDLTWQLIAGLNWEFKKDFIAKAGYRVLDWDYEDGGTVWDMQASGMYLGLGIRF